jgi:hypothetical protein
MAFVPKGQILSQRWTVEAVSATRDSRRSMAQTPRHSPLHAVTLLSYAILLGGAVTMGITAYMVIVTYAALPYADGWEEVGAAAYGSSQLNPAWLWVQHSEHRLVIPKLFLALDLDRFHASQKFLLASIFLIQFLHLMLLGWSMRALGGWRGALWRTGMGLAALCLFCPTQWENFVWGFQVCFVLPCLFATASIVGLLRYWMDSRQPDRKPSWTWLVIANLAALGATYSLANGNLLWPILIAAAILLRLRFAAALSFVLTGAVSSALYLFHYIRPRWHADPVSSLRQPVTLFKYLTAYFGSSFIRGNFPAAAILGFAGLCLAAAVVLGFWSYVRSGRVFAVQLVLTLVFCVGTGFLTALGRLNFGIGQAFASRYQTIAMLFWCCLGLMALLYATTGERNLLVTVQVCLLVVMVGGALRVRSAIAGARLHAFRLDQAAMSLLTGVSDEVNFGLASGERPQQIKAEIKYLRNHRMSVFADDAYLQLDTPLKSAFDVVSPGQCQGELRSTTPLASMGGPALGISGWAWDYKHQQPPVRVLATINGVITGLAAVGEGKPEVRAANPQVKSDWAGFAGYVRDVRPGTPVSLYAVLGENPSQACLLTTFNYSEVK